MLAVLVEGEEQTRSLMILIWEHSNERDQGENTEATSELDTVSIQPLSKSEILVHQFQITNL